MKEEQEQQAVISGLAGLYAFQQKSVADGKKLFDLVMQEQADGQALSGVVYQESLLQLIFYVLDHRKLVTSRVSQIKSAEQRTAASQAEKQKVLKWCDANPETARLAYKSAVPLAMEQTKITASTSVRDYISVWRKVQSKE